MAYHCVYIKQFEWKMVHKVGLQNTVNIKSAISLNVNSNRYLKIFQILIGTIPNIHAHYVVLPDKTLTTRIKITSSDQGTFS